jgi:hypothetical protein
VTGRVSLTMRHRRSEECAIATDNTVAAFFKRCRDDMCGCQRLGPSDEPAAMGSSSRRWLGRSVRLPQLQQPESTGTGH